MFPLPTHQRRRSFTHSPRSALGPPGPLEPIEDEVPGLSSPRKPHHLTRRFPVPLPWQSYWDSFRDVEVPERNATFRVYFGGDSGPVVFCLHGGGYTALTWSLIASELKQKYRVVAVDFRGHGETITTDDADLSAETLVEDTVAVMTELYGKLDEPPPIVLVGHSMGGAIAVKTAASGKIESFAGLVVIDVVEGTALGSLPHMMTILNKRPASFVDLESAVEWALASRTSRNEESACISVPSMLMQSESTRFIWRTALKESEEHWTGWFTGLSELFLGLTVPKLLVLVGTDRLDRTLTIGQMQGRFQMSVMPASGHAVQEDEPDRVAETVDRFLERFRIGQKLPSFVRR